MDKLKMHSVNKVDENIVKIGKLFPNCVTERKNENGETELAIDFDMLRQELSSVIVEGNEERYQFTWPDKKKSILLANAPIAKTLRPCREESVDFDTTENLYIEGDNLDVLKLLQETYMGKIKMIYIDPPYNTGHDFVYEDDFAQSTDTYMANSGQFDDEGNRLVANTESNGRFHTDWLNMIYPRLKLGKNLLKENGVIFISIDDNELNNLLRMCNEIYGENNLVAIFPWQSRLSMQNDTDISSNHEYVVAYAKNRRQENRRLKEANASSWYNDPTFACLPLPLNRENYDNPDNDPRGPWKADPFDAPNVRPNLTYAIVNPQTGAEHWPPQGRHWRTEEKNYQKWLEDNRIVFGKNGDGRPQLKVFYNEKKDFGSIDTTWWTGEKCGTATQGTKEQMQLFGGFAPFDTPKPVKMIKQILSLVSRPDDSDIVLDFFSGSATTAHAVFEKNYDDGGNRRFILVQLDEKTSENSQARKKGYVSIPQIGKERIRRAGKKILEDAEKEVADAASCGESYEVDDIVHKHKSLDVGFRVLKCDTSNMKDVYYSPADYEMSMFDILADNIKEDRTPEDLLFQVMLDLGVLLSSKIEESTIGGKKVFNVADGFLMACFDANITEDVIAEIAKQKPYYFVMRDSSMASDSVATNFEQIFATYSPDTVRKVL